MAVKIRNLTYGAASCTLWLEGTPQIANFRTASIGAFTADDPDAGQALLAQAMQTLQAENYEYVIGPLNGTTWHSYRLVTETDRSPPFFLEPANPDFHPALFTQAGFDIIGRYNSARTGLTESYGVKTLPGGIRLRNFDPANAQRELEKIFHLSLKAFAGNFLYTPITQADFLALYEPILPRLLPDYILMAENAAGDLQGFLFALPNYAQGKNPDQLIIKTYASLQRGIGGALVDRIHLKAQQAGFTSVIHALMHDDNVSRKNSEQYAKPFRRYALYGRRIAP